MLYNKRHALQSRLEIIICQLVSYKEGIDHHEGVIDAILSDPVEDFPQYALDNARRNLVYCRNELERAEIEYYAVKKELAWYEFIDAECTYDILYADKHANMLAIYNLHTTANNHKQRALYFRNNNCPIVAQSHLQKAYDAEWMLFQECN